MKEIKSILGKLVKKARKEYSDIIIDIDSNDNIEVLKKLKKEGYSYLVTMCGIHYPKANAEFQVMYQLRNLIDNSEVRVKAAITNEKNEIESVVKLFPTANWMERQEFDFFGIQFLNHPNLSRILNMDEMVEHPMRKEFKLEDPTREDKDDRFFGRQ